MGNTLRAVLTRSQHLVAIQTDEKNNENRYKNRPLNLYAVNTQAQVIRALSHVTVTEFNW